MAQRFNMLDPAPSARDWNEGTYEPYDDSGEWSALRAGYILGAFALFYLGYRSIPLGEGVWLLFTGFGVLALIGSAFMRRD